MITKSMWIVGAKISLLSVLCLAFFSFEARAQTSISSGTISGTAVDPNNAVVASATVEVFNAVTNYRQVARTDSNGGFRFNNVPFSSYRLTISADGFELLTRQIEVQTIVPLNLGSQSLAVLGTQATVEVAGDQNLLENVPTTQTNVNQTLLQRLPTSSPASGLSDAVILTTPGIATDANGFFHPLGDHAQTSIFLDNQPISDQQSTAFSTHLPLEAFQSLTIITGTPNAEYGDKTSLVIDAVTRSGLGLKRPSGSFALQAGSFS
ncbi:MAG TPA: carboxypeptidase-like regulatory domain-containing protein, partial [Pyrinomonadaceae bacterium]|nr:carboxypeptidase-like regulatory domain-containing protein [Pyrinomonadaceae bacterium]